MNENRDIISAKSNKFESEPSSYNDESSSSCTNYRFILPIINNDIRKELKIANKKIKNSQKVNIQIPMARKLGFKEAFEGQISTSSSNSSEKKH